MRLALMTALVGLLACAAPAAAVERYVPMKGAPGAGPARYDRVFRGLKRLVRMSRIQALSIVDDRGVSHLDPLSDALRRNDFLRTVVPFLRRVAH